MIKILNACKLSKFTLKICYEYIFTQILSCTTKDVLTHKHLRSIIKHTLLNKLLYVKHETLQKFGVFIVTISSYNYNFDFQIPILTYNAHHNHLMYAINTKK